MASFELIEAPGRRWLRSFGRAPRDFSAALAHPDGRRLIAAQRDGTAWVWDLRDGTRLHHLPAMLSAQELEDARAVSLLLSPDGARLYALRVTP